MTDRPTTVFQAGALSCQGITSAHEEEGHDPHDAIVVDHGHYLMGCRCCGALVEWTVRITERHGMEATIIADTVSGNPCPGRRQ